MGALALPVEPVDERLEHEREPLAVAVVGCMSDDLALTLCAGQVVGTVVQQQLAAVGADPERIFGRELEPVQACAVELLVPLFFERHEKSDPVGARYACGDEIEQYARRRRANRLDDAGLRLQHRVCVDVLDAGAPEGIPHCLSMVERRQADDPARACNRVERTLVDHLTSGTRGSAFIVAQAPRVQCRSGSSADAIERRSPASAFR